MDSMSSETVRKAITARVTATCHAECAEGPEEFTVQLLDCATSDGVQGFWAQVKGSNPSCLNKVMAADTPVMLTFQFDGCWVACSCKVRKARGWPWQGKTLFLTFPDHAKITQRRRGSRERVSRGQVIRSAVLLPDTTTAAGRLFDVSDTGAAFLFEPSPQFAELKVGDLVRAEIRAEQSPVILPAVVRRLRSAVDGLLVAVEFGQLPEQDRSVQNLRILVELLTAERMRIHFLNVLRLRKVGA
jgi:c-di-GMP-binding flagellar brake protein YcgR